MIAWLRGACQSVSADQVVVDVSGVGYLVQVSLRDAATWQIGETIELLVHTVVREDAIALFGFASAAARDLFISLVSVPGVGPKGALALLSELTPRDIALAIHNHETKQLVRAKGIGKRTAEVIVVRLRERLPPELLAGESADPVGGGGLAATISDAQRDAVSALVNLGYRAAMASEAIDAALSAGASDDLSSLVRSALALLRRRTAS